MALWYIPKALEKSNDAEITKRKGKAIAVIACIVFVVYQSSATEMRNLPSSSGGQNICKSCERSFPAGDAGGNYKNIAKTGMCKNCYKNYKSLDDFLD